MFFHIQDILCFHSLDLLQPAFGFFAQSDSINLFLLHCHVAMIQYIDTFLSNLNSPIILSVFIIFLLLIYIDNRFSGNNTHSTKQQSFQSRMPILLHNTQNGMSFFFPTCTTRYATTPKVCKKNPIHLPKGYY